MSGAMTEFKITSDLSALRQQVIDANFDEVRAWLIENLAPYRDMAVSADDLSTAKSYRANIRKVRDRIDQSRKEAKAAALEAYTLFEAKCKELTGLCDETANDIDAKVKAFEDAERKEKIENLHAEYVALTNDELELYCPWENIFDPKWGNKSFPYDHAFAEINAALSQTKVDIEAIREMGGSDTPYLLDVYKQTHSMTAVVRKASELQTMREREEARKREAEEAAARAKERFAQTISAAQAPVIEAEDEPIVTVSFRVTCTKAQLTALGQYMKQNGIKYGRCV